MPVEAILTCWGNSHPFQERRMSLSEPAKIGRSVAQSRPTSSNAIFDCKVLSRNHALMWHDNGKFYLQDTKSSNGTFVNNQRLSKGAEESSPKEIFSNDILQFGVDVVENSRKVTHSCIIATLKLLDSDGREITKSSLSNDSSSVVVNNVQSHEFYQLLQYLQEALHREQLLESKLTVVQQLVQATQESTENNWQNLVNEEKLLSRLETLEKQLSICSKLQPDGSLQQELITLQNDKFHYESLAKNSLKKVIGEKVEAVKKLNDVERTLNNKEEECSHLKDVSQLIQTELNALSEKFQDQFKDLQNVQQQLQVYFSLIMKSCPKFRNCLFNSRWLV
ncbi:hypothetical protein HELRODRAFT_86939 [Helobdella robusta]|uniref:Sarcolemmal membrane-associated protein n=1 Tax=Helobdella robusta TaxID=6412 RepID=T1G6J4_HELRO|nr:hypothetical protein HELRODRAFT_86939 [Helobdella robusta]ESN95207.1 hypothetical protein HELRODRAFT_86939 [Helobdella robusta]